FTKQNLCLKSKNRKRITPPFAAKEKTHEINEEKKKEKTNGKKNKWTMTLIRPPSTLCGLVARVRRSCFLLIGPLSPVKVHLSVAAVEDGEL
ncbi:hypothetical protein M8C21_024381, partial [Ambrosia artemisiifolia]